VEYCILSSKQSLVRAIFTMSGDQRWPARKEGIGA
jgi:hypothetical protein